MAKCHFNIVADSRPDLAVQPQFLPAKIWCTTHQMAPTDSSGMCPVGRIEDAIEKAREKTCGTCGYWNQMRMLPGSGLGQCTQPEATIYTLFGTELIPVFTTDLTGCSKWIPKQGPKEST